MGSTTRCIECEDYFRNRKSVGDPLVKVLDPDQVQAILHSKQAVRPKLMSRIAGESLVWIDGPDWLVRRRMTQGSFQPHNDAHQKEIVDWVVSGLLERLDRAAVSGETISLVEEFLRMTTRFLYRFAFDITLPPDHDKAPMVGAFFDAVFELSYSMLDISRSLSAELMQGVRQAFGDMDDEIELIMESDPVSGSLLHALIEGRDAGVLTDTEARDEVRGLFLAGTETTSLTMAWVWSLLDQHEVWRERVEEEVASDGPTPLLEAVLNETLRLYPAVPFTTRVVEASTDLGFERFDERTEFLLSIYHTHRNPEHWDDPDDFDPERFLGEQDRHRYAWLPFGGGRHLCIGNRVARMEALDALQAILRRYRFHRVDDIETVALMGITLKPSHPIRVTVERVASS